MKKKLLPLFLCLCMGSTSYGCGVKTTPEIIMPDKPMESSASLKETPETSEGSSDAGQGATTTDGSKVSSDRETSENYKVYLITMDLTDSYWQSIDKGCQQAVSELGNITYQWLGPDSHDDALQSKCIDDAVAGGANAILLAANSAEGVNDSLQKAEDAGCKIVYVDSAASHSCVTALATDNEAAGKKAGETMMQALGDKGVNSGTIGILGVTKDTASCVARETGFREAFEGTDYELADTVYMQDNTENVKNAVKSGIEKGYVGFFGANEGTTVAVGEGKKEAGASDNVVVGFDASDAVLSLVSDGTVYATMQQNPQAMGYEGLKIAIQALEGSYTDTDTNTDTGVTVITAESM